MLYLRLYSGNVFRNVSLNHFTFSSQDCSRLLFVSATSIFTFSQKTIHKWAFLNQRLFCHSTSVILPAVIIRSGFRINEVLISESFYFIRERVVAQWDAIECQFHGFLLLAMDFSTYCYGRCCFHKLNEITLLALIKRKNVKELLKYATSWKTKGKKSRLTRRALMARCLIVRKLNVQKRKSNHLTYGMNLISFELTIQLTITIQLARNNQ